MAITEATNQDWIDFWEGEDITEHAVPVNRLAKLRDELKEQIAVAFCVWDMGEFEIRSDRRLLCRGVHDMNTYDPKHYREVLRYYEWIKESKSFNQRWERFKKSKSCSSTTPTKL